jgi:hypothetical protein
MAIEETAGPRRRRRLLRAVLAVLAVPALLAGVVLLGQDAGDRGPTLVTGYLWLVAAVCAVLLGAAAMRRPPVLRPLRLIAFGGALINFVILAAGYLGPLFRSTAAFDALGRRAFAAVVVLCIASLGAGGAGVSRMGDRSDG